MTARCLHCNAYLAVSRGFCRRCGARYLPAPTAVTMGQAGGRARAAALSPDRRREIAQHAAKARWGRRTEP